MNRTDIIDILQSWMEKSNQLTIEDRIIVYELMAVGCCIKFDDDDFVSPPNDVKPDCLKLILLSNNFY